MADISIRPEMRTNGGEVNDILCDGRFVGMLTMVYRESDRLMGILSLQQQALFRHDKPEIERWAQRYVYQMASAIGAKNCDWIVVHGSMEHPDRNFKSVRRMSGASGMGMGGGQGQGKAHKGANRWSLPTAQSMQYAGPSIYTNMGGGTSTNPDELYGDYDAEDGGSIEMSGMNHSQGSQGQMQHQSPQGPRGQADSQDQQQQSRRGHGGGQQGATRQSSGRQQNQDERQGQGRSQGQSFGHGQGQISQSRGQGQQQQARPRQQAASGGGQQQGQQQGQGRTLELALVGEVGGRVEFQVHDQNREWVAEATLRLRGSEMYGEVNWMEEPSDADIEQIVNLIATEYEDTRIRTYTLEMFYDGQPLETVEMSAGQMSGGSQGQNQSPQLGMGGGSGLGQKESGSSHHRGGTRNGGSGLSRQGSSRDQGDQGDKKKRDGSGSRRGAVDSRQDSGNRNDRQEDNCHVVLVRDDGDALTYDIYVEDSRKPVGTAKFDLSREEISGSVEFMHEQDEQAREDIAFQLLRELDKEREFEACTLSIIENSEIVDEMVFESSPVH